MFGLVLQYNLFAIYYLFRCMFWLLVLWWAVVGLASQLEIWSLEAIPYENYPLAFDLTTTSSVLTIRSNLPSIGSLNIFREFERRLFRKQGIDVDITWSGLVEANSVAKRMSSNSICVAFLDGEYSKFRQPIIPLSSGPDSHSNATFLSLPFTTSTVTINTMTFRLTAADLQKFEHNIVTILIVLRDRHVDNLVQLSFNTIAIDGYGLWNGPVESIPHTIHRNDNFTDVPFNFAVDIPPLPTCGDGGSGFRVGESAGCFCLLAGQPTCEDLHYKQQVKDNSGAPFMETATKLLVGFADVPGSRYCSIQPDGTMTKYIANCDQLAGLCDPSKDRTKPCCAVANCAWCPTYSNCSFCAFGYSLTPQRTCTVMNMTTTARPNATDTMPYSGTNRETTPLVSTSSIRSALGETSTISNSPSRTYPDISTPGSPTKTTNEIRSTQSPTVENVVSIIVSVFASIPTNIDDMVISTPEVGCRLLNLLRIF